MLNECRVKGYEWALSQALHSDYNDFTSWSAFAEKCLKDTPLADAIPGDEEVLGLWQAWEMGVFDAKVFLRDDAFLSVADIVGRTDFDRSYIQAELKAKRLKGMKVGNSYAIHPDDFRTWLANPKRGSRAKKGDDTQE